MATEKEDADLEAEVEEHETAIAALCAALSAAFTAQPLLCAQLPVGAPGNITPHTLLEHLGRVESLVVRLVGKNVVSAAAEARAARVAIEKEREEAYYAPAPAIKEGEASPGASFINRPSIKEEPTATEAALSAGGDSHGRRGRISVQPPSMSTDAGSLSLLSESKLIERAKDERLDDNAAPREPSLDFGKLKFGRASLRSELMGQILAGVTQQVHRLLPPNPMCVCIVSTSCLGRCLTRPCLPS